MKRYAYVEFGGIVMAIETRCSCIYLQERKNTNELAIEEIVTKDLIKRYVEIPDGVEVSEGMIYSNGEFKATPPRPIFVTE